MLPMDPEKASQKGLIDISAFSGNPERRIGK